MRAINDLHAEVSIECQSYVPGSEAYQRGGCPSRGKQPPRIWTRFVLSATIELAHLGSPMAPDAHMPSTWSPAPDSGALSDATSSCYGCAPQQEHADIPKANRIEMRRSHIAPGHPGL